MSWKDLLQDPSATVTVPWTGGRRLPVPRGERTISGRLPREWGWHVFRDRGRHVEWVGPAESPLPDRLSWEARGYLVGDRLVEDGSRVDPDPAAIASGTETVFLIEDGLPRFSRVQAGRVAEWSPLVYACELMPEGPEADVLAAFQDRAETVSSVKGVTPALDAAFRMATLARLETERARAELERARAEAEAREAEERRVAELSRTLSDARGRRAMAAVDFAVAARAALAVGGAEYLDHRRSHGRDEMVVNYRVDGRRLECVCDASTLRITDAGVCLTAGGVRGDNFFTLESLPAVIRQAERERVLVVLRRTGSDPSPDYGDDDWDD